MYVYGLNYKYIIEGVNEMPRTRPFDEYSQEYDNWFTENHNIYRSEIKAIKEFIPFGLCGVEIGVGSGRFSVPLDIKTGVEPSEKMAEIARSRGITVFEGVAESLPFKDGQFDYALMVTTICFVDDVEKSLKEANRVLKNGGFIIVAFIDKKSELGMQYQKHKENNEFYRNATFYSVKEVEDLLCDAGFKNLEYRQTVFTRENIVHDVQPGIGKGGFVVIKATK